MIIPKSIIIALITFLCASTPSQAREVDPNSPIDFFEMSIEQLMEVSVTVSSSRQTQKINQSSAPVSIVSSDDIHYSGLTNIPEILQFVPGVDIVKFNRYLYGVGIHGLHESISNHVVSLVDGRYANNTIFGGPEFHKLPLFLEDIERIEVVRGPGGAAWGANAFTGVINIITKEPEKTVGFFGSTTLNEYGDRFTHLRWGGKKDEWSWRFSTGYEDLETSDDAGAGKYTTSEPALNDFIGYNDYVARDFSRTWKFDSTAVYTSDDIKVSIGAGYSHLITGNYEINGYYPMDQNNRSETLRLFTKAERQFDDGSSGHLQWFGNFSTMNWSNLAYYESVENDIEVQLNFAPIGSHHLSVGGNFRWDDISTKDIITEPSEFIYRDSPYHERWAGCFAIDRWDITDQFTLEAQVRGDWYSEVTTDWSNRVTALYDLDGTDKHILRLSVAKAFRSPLISLRQLEARNISIFGAYYQFNTTLPEDLKNEETWTVEAGYSGQLTDRVLLNINAFHQRLSNLIGYRTVLPDFTPGIDFVSDNIDGADTYGGEIELAYQDKHKKLSVWYAYEHFELDQADQPIRAFQPPKFKCGLTGRWFFTHDWTFNVNYRLNGKTPRNPFVPSEVGDLDSYHRLDLTLSKTFAQHNGELMFGVSDLFNQSNQAILETTNVTNHETPGRTFFARLQMHF
jgi:iron complex outermembrane receptor protein